MAATPRIERRPAARIAYVEHRGAYDALPFGESIPRLYAWAKGAKVMPGFFPLGIYLDPPRVPAGRRRSRIAITYKGQARGKAPVRTGRLRAMTVAAVSHKAPASEFAATYRTLQGWIAAKGLRVSGPAMEIYSRKPERKGGRTIVHAKVMLPVARR